MKPKISVVIPAYNEEKLIATCVRAVVNQSLAKDQYEVLVIDNNSSDKTAQIAKKEGATVIPYTEKQGFAEAKQFGTSQANADIIAYTDADSVPEHEWLEKLLMLMANEQYQCIGGTILSTDSKGLSGLSFVLYDYLAAWNQLFGVSLIWSPNMAVRKAAFDAIGGFNLSIKTSDDWEFILRMQKKFGRKSTLYSRHVLVKTSPRRQQSLSLMIPYTYIGIANYLTLFVLRIPKTYGAPRTKR